jgi:glutamyl-tRNA reductase
MHLLLTGLSHKTAPVALRERMAFGGEQLYELLPALCAAAEVSECCILSTCNRTELYAVSSEPGWQERILEFLARHAGVSPGPLQEHLYCFEGTPAVRHLFRVAGGLDSMVVGEGQILAQVKEALAQAQAAETAGALIHALFQQALSAGKRARAETGIGRGAVSVSLAAVQLAKQIFGRLAGRTVLILGAGENSEQTARLLLNEGVSRSILVTNRTEERARALAERISGSVIPFDRFPEALERADIVISSTGAPHPILRRERLQAARRARRGRPIFLIDIAVPRDIEPEVGELDDVFLYNIDDLQGVVERSLQVRQAEVERVEAIVEEEVIRFQGWLRGREIAPTIADLQRQAEAVVEAELGRAREKLASLPEGEQAMVDALVRRVTRRLLLPAILHLREAAASGNGYHEVNAVRTIFRLDGAEEEAGEEAAP